jgi:uncharacterized alkaline shock family protein YloU
MSVLVDEPAGTVVVSSSALTQIAVRAAESVADVRVRRPRRQLEITIEGGRARVALALAVRHGVVLPEAARAVQERVGEALARMCDVGVDAVDITVEEVV